MIKTTKNRSKTNTTIAFASFAAAASFAALIAIRLFWLDGRVFSGANAVGLIVIFCIYALLQVIELAIIGRYHGTYIGSRKHLAFLLTVQFLYFGIFLFIEKLSIYIVPVTFSVTLVTIFLISRVAYVSNFFTTVILSLTLQYLHYGDPSYAVPNIFYLVNSFAAGTVLLFFVSNNSKRLRAIVMGVTINLMAFPVLAAVSLLIGGVEGFSAIHFAYLAAGILISVFLSITLQPVFESIFNLISNYRLIELTDHNNPLLVRLADEAPGTFTHSLTMASMAEMCARAIGENVYLARACAYYHDVGKLDAPNFFKENQSDNVNPHDELTPEVSTSILVRHPAAGYEICKKYRIPKEIARAALEHHGTLPAFYFYTKAVEMADGKIIDMSKYSYIGARPGTRINGIIMICDACEAILRSMDKQSDDAVGNAVKNAVHTRLDSGQFDDCDLTTAQLATIRDTIISAYCGLFHERVLYKPFTNS
ncbi:MAG: HDIG domain-containing protein [Firmicutes bacterium]|nr:HDIG domain-containing protein [Bacillota bacterium]